MNNKKYDYLVKKLGKDAVDKILANLTVLRESDNISFKEISVENNPWQCHHCLGNNNDSNVCEWCGNNKKELK